MIDYTIFQNSAVSCDHSGIGNLKILEFFGTDNFLRIRRCLGFRFYNIGGNVGLFLFFGNRNWIFCDRYLRDRIKFNAGNETIRERNSIFNDQLTAFGTDFSSSYHSWY